ncbi:MAG TPA: acyl-CoA thioester hydrolase/BAAT C-terminal domain-containing protein [archaeon]|nr:acyl-CoA thioester hydrolase/BAAT C-terminal domain-containing protein [archaeon]
MRILIFTFVSAILWAGNTGPLFAWNENYSALQKHFERVTNERFNALFKGIKNVEQWEKERVLIKAKLLKQMGLDRAWPKDPPACRITHRIERKDYLLECMVFETAPGLYATANFYIPRGQGPGPYPLVIYQCGHGPGGPYGGKSRSKHHSAWFAAHGISSLLLDPIEMGELHVTHHAVYDTERYDLYSCGYSPLAVETYNARRAIDYLVTRPEVDSEKIGCTGISGGGATTFFLTLTDERIKASAPVSGVCSTVGHIEGRLASRHCDCMYPLNSYGLLFSEMGSLFAPRPFLLCNSLADPIFPMPYFNQMVEKIREIYHLYGAEENLGTVTVPGGHSDSEMIRLPVYAFFLKELRGLDTTITEHGQVDTLFMDSLLVIRDGYPLNERVTRIHDEFMPVVNLSQERVAPGELDRKRSELSRLLRESIFDFFPSESGVPFQPEWEDGITDHWARGGIYWKKSQMWGRLLKRVSFNSFKDLSAKGVYSLPEHHGHKGRLPAVLALREKDETQRWRGRTLWEGYNWGDRAVLAIETLDVESRSIDDSLRHHMQREAMIAGRSFDEIRVYEILRSLEFLRSQPEVDPERVTIVGRGIMGINGLYAAFLDEKVERVVLQSPPASHLEGPYYLGILTVTDIPEMIALMADKVYLYGRVPLEISSALKLTAPERAAQFSSMAECFE